MSVVSMSIKGLRGFAEEQILQFAQPNGETGSGLTILVGPNNGGKSTIIESIQALAAPLSNPPRFTEGQRNKVSGFVSSSQTGPPWRFNRIALILHSQHNGHRVQSRISLVSCLHPADTSIRTSRLENGFHLLATIIRGG